MKKIILAVLILTIGLSFAACSGGSKGKMLVKVGSSKITEGDLDMLATINPRLKAQIATDFGRQKILDNMVEQEILYQAAVKDGLENRSDVKDKINIYKKVIISQSYMDEQIGKEAKKYYDEHKNEFDKLKLSDITIKFKGDGKDKAVRNEKEALDLANKAKARLDAGEDFAEVAKTMSDDTMTNKRGGDLGFTARDEARLMRRGYGPLLEKAFTMKVGEISGPIKTEDSYHIITVTQGSELQPFDAVEQAILFKIRGDAKNTILTGLKEKIKVEYPNQDKKAAAPATAAVPPTGEAPAAVVPTDAPVATPEAKATETAAPKAEGK